MDYLEFSDLVELTALDPELVRYAEVLGDQAAETMDILVRDVIAGGTNVMYAGSATSRVTVAATDKLTVAEIKKARRQFKKNGVKPLSGGDYVLVISPDQEFDLYADTTFAAAMQNRSDIGTLYSGEIARLFGFRIVVVPNAKVFEGAGATGANVHAAIALGADAYGLIDIDGSGAVKNIIKPLGSSGTADALDQRQTTGWKVTAFAAKRLQEQAIIRIETGVTGNGGQGGLGTVGLNGLPS